MAACHDVTSRGEVLLPSAVTSHVQRAIKQYTCIRVSVDCTRVRVCLCLYAFGQIGT